MNLKVSGYNISSDEDEYSYRTDSISFSRDEVENKKSRYNLYHQLSDFPNEEYKVECEKLFKSFTDFIKKQKLEELITDKYILKKLR